MKNRLYFVIALLLVGLCAWLAAQTSHTVVKGDNLWNISKTYLNNPFRWKDIWEWNPFIKNPHLIYPGQVVSLNGKGQDSTGTGAKTKEQNELTFDQKVSGLGSSPSQSATNPLKSPSEKLEGKLKEDFVMRAPQILPVNRKGEALTSNIENWVDVNQGFHLFDTQPLEKKHDQEGFMELMKEGPLVKNSRSKKVLGRVLEPSGILELRVDSNPAFAGSGKTRKINATLIAQFNSITKLEKVRPYAARKIDLITGYEKMDGSQPVGQIIYTSSSARSVLPYTYIITDYSSDGMSLRQGDGVAFLNHNQVTGKATDKFLGFGIVVLEQEASATILVTEVFPGVLGQGDFVRITHRAIRS